MNIQHSSRSDRWFTPLWIIDRVKAVLGDIDLDPATEQAAQERIKAKNTISKDAEDAHTPWLNYPGTVYCNPPGGRKGNKSKTGLFWERLMHEVAAGYVSHAIFLAFSVEALQHTQRLNVASIAEFPFCVPKKRIAFDYPDGTKGIAPSHSNLIVYVPGTVNNRMRFIEVFEDIGAIINKGVTK